MAIRTVGPYPATYPSIAAAMAAAGPGDTIQLASGYKNETATVAFLGMIIEGDASSTGIILQLATGVSTVSLLGKAPINVLDASDGNGIVGNAGNNVVVVTNGSDSVDGGLGTDRLVVDYHLATGAVTGDSMSNVTEAGGSRLVSITANTFEHFTIRTGSGADTITTYAGDDIINTGAGASTVNAGEGANVITGGSGADTVTGLNGGNIVSAGDGANIVTTGSGNDVITGGINADTIVSGDGTDLITVNGGADSVDGGAGSDRLVIDYSALTTSFIGGVVSGNLLAGYSGSVGDGAGNDVGFQPIEHFTITTGSGNDRISTGDGTDVLNGGAGTDKLSSGGGNDIINGGLGIDMLLGGAGNDTYIVDNSGDRAFETTTMSSTIDAGGTDTVQSSVSYNLDFNAGLRFVENLTLTGTGNIYGTGNALANTLTGNTGNNTLIGGLGADTLLGGAGNDTYIVDNSGDRAFETTTLASTIDAGGVDSVQSSVSYNLDFNAGLRFVENLTLTGTGNINGNGNTLANVLTGNAGNNKLNGGLGIDMLLGGAGNDTYIVDNSGDRAFETTTMSSTIDAGGTDTVQSSVSYNLDFNAGLRFVENLTLTGTGNIYGTGNALANTLTGNTGNNTLNGGLGVDSLLGGAGNDTFVFRAREDSGIGAARDVINDFEDFSGDDTIDLSGFVGTLNYIGQAGFSAANQVRAIQSGADVLIEINTVGTSGAESEILLKATVIGTIDIGDFIG